MAFAGNAICATEMDSVKMEDQIRRSGNHKLQLTRQPIPCMTGKKSCQKHLRRSKMPAYTHLRISDAKAQAAEHADDIAVQQTL